MATLDGNLPCMDMMAVSLARVALFYLNAFIIHHIHNALITSKISY